jgi:hypothetical protein
VMLASMAPTHQGTEHHMPAPEAPHHHPLPLNCCDLCVIACAGALGIPCSAPSVGSARAAQDVRLVTTEERSLRSAAPHRLPFSIGPPTLRIA